MYKKIPAHIENLIEQGENQLLDFKFEISDSKKIAKTLVAFANTNGGTLLIGVKDNGEVIGIEREYKVADRGKPNWDGYTLFLTYKLDLLGTPLAGGSFTFFQYHITGKFVCAIETTPSDKPIFVNDEFFIRSGTRAIPLKGYAMQEYINNKREAL